MQNAVGSLWAELVDAATDVAQALVGRFQRVPVISLISDEDKILRTEAGEPIDDLATGLEGAACRLALPSHWFFRVPLNPIPAESRPFLDVFARQQVERVTPWRESDVYVSVAAEACEEDKTRLQPILTVMPKSLVDSQIAKLENYHCSSISIWSSLKEDHFEISVGGGVKPRSSLKADVSIGLAAVFILLPGIAGLCWWQSAASQSKANQFARQLTQMRSALVQANRQSAEDDAASAKSDFVRPPIVLLLEEISAALPDTCYLTRLSIDGDRANIAGVSINPPELVPVLEKTGRFSDVSFSDAITRSETGAGNHFGLEMRIESMKGAAE